MASVPPSNQVPITPQPQPTQLPIEQPPPDITISSFTGEKKSGKPLNLLFSILFFLFGIIGIAYGAYMQIQMNKLKQLVTKTASKNASSPTPTIPKPTVPLIQNTSSTSADIENPTIKETLCFNLTLTQKNEVGQENNCDITLRTFPDTNNRERAVGLAVFLHNKPYTNSQDMADQWLQLEKDHGSDESIIEKTPVQVGGIEGFKVITEYANKAVQTTHIFVYVPEKYEAYGNQITGFELLSASDPESRPIQQTELNRLMSTWVWK